MVETAEEPKEEEEDVQSTVDCALAAFAAAHQLDVVGIFCSDEWQWEAVLEAINQGPLPPLNECYEATPAVLLARAAIHRNQVANQVADGVRVRLYM